MTIFPHRQERSEHRSLAASVRSSLREWRRFVIAIDGVDGAGKTELARYLSWQLGMPAVETDLFLIPESGLTYRQEDLAEVVHGRLRHDRPLIVEGVRILHTLRNIGVKHDYLVWVEQIGYEGSFGLRPDISGYMQSFNPRSTANSVFSWQDPETN